MRQVVIALLALGMGLAWAQRNPRVGINILHINDVHNRFEAATASATHCRRSDDDAGRCFGGYARIATVVKAERQKDPSTLLLDAGDQMIGSPWDAIYKGNLTAQFQNLLRPDAMVLGNHEFDFGSRAASTYVRQLSFPMLGACNIDFSGSRFLKTLVKKYIVKRIKGKNVAILGVSTVDTAVTSSANDEERFIDPIIGLNGCMQEMFRTHGKKIDAVIVLSHAGYQIDLKIANEVPNVDLVIGGHSHYLLWTGPTPPKILADPRSNDTGVMGPYPTNINNTYAATRRVPVVTAFTASRYIGKVVLSIGGGRPSSVTGRPILLGGVNSSNPVARDAAVDRVIQGFAGPVNEFAFKLVGQSSVFLNQSLVRVNESNIGNLICDSLMEYAATKTQLGGVNACIYNGGGIRTSIAAGNVSMGALTTVMPFGNQVAIVAVKGTDLIQALYNSISAVGLSSGTGRFGQVAGLRYVFNASLATPADFNQPMQAKARLVYAKLLVNGAEVDINPCSTYTIITNDYLAAGGDNYFMLPRGDELLPNGRPVEYVVADYITRYSPVAPGLEDRIINCALATHPACAAPSRPADVCT